MMNEYGYLSPMGNLSIRLEGDAVSRISFDSDDDTAPLPRNHFIHKALDRYFETGEGLENVPVKKEGTDFQLAVWDVLNEIPPGEVQSYSWVAARIGKPGAARAVGSALGANAVPIVVPCHRVTAAAGLGGYAGGLDWKDYLLKLEGYSAPASSDKRSAASAAAGF